VPDESTEEALSLVRRRAERKREAEVQLRAAIEKARAQGAVWREIGEAMGAAGQVAKNLVTDKTPDLRVPANVAALHARLDAVVAQQPGHAGEDTAREN
jgi:hypothetical protein